MKREEYGEIRRSEKQRRYDIYDFWNISKTK